MKPLCEWTNHLHRGFLLLLKIFQRPQDAQPSPNGDDLGGLGGIPQQAFWPVQSGQNRKTCICLHCLPVLSRIRDKIGYTESWIIPKPYFSACFHADFVQKIRDNFFSLLSWFQYFFIRSFPTFGIIL